MDSDFITIIVDGYNFLKSTGMLAQKVANDQLEVGRKKLLALLAKHFPTAESIKKKKPDAERLKGESQLNGNNANASSSPRIIVVFDSQTTLNLPKSYRYRGIDVRFSKGYDNADELIIELIQSHHVPKRLLVVSSDHEIQEAARRRKAQAIDSEEWLDQLETEIQNKKRYKRSLASPSKELDDSQYWLSVFQSELAEESSSTENLLEQDSEETKQQETKQKE